MSSNTLAAETCSDAERTGLVFDSSLAVGLLDRPRSAREHESDDAAVSAAAVPEPANAGSSLRVVCRDLIQLTKPRIVTMILVTTVSTAMIAAGGLVPIGAMLLLLFATALVAGSAGGANQIWERVIDRQMPRTASRPLPAARMSTGVATAYTCSIGTLGTALLWIGFGIVPALVGVLTWLSYVFVYTPMKTRTSWNTTVGAIAGALPMLIGYTALGGSLVDWTGWLLFGVLAAWQYPHFMAIAWLYRRQYAEAGFCMSTTVEPTGLSAAIQSILGSVAVIVCSLALCFGSPGLLAGTLGSFAVLLAAVPMLKASIRFANERNDQAARRLLRSSLLVLPAVLAVVTIRVFW